MSCTGCAARRARAVKWLRIAAERAGLVLATPAAESPTNQPAKSEPTTG